MEAEMRTLIVICIIVAFIAPSSAQKRYYKGNTHTHSYPNSSDADTTHVPAKAVSNYKANGYSFLVFTDHVYWWNSSGLSTPDFTVISGSEPGLSGGYKGHFTAVRIKKQITGTGKTFQQLINDIYADGGVPFLNHPRWATIPLSASQVINEMKDNLNHVEIYNGQVDSPTTWSATLWDSVLTTGRKIYGVACDDSHRQSHEGRGWICVYASSIHQDTLTEAIRRGDFYASSGIVLDSIAYASDHLYVKSVNGTSIRFVGKGGQLLTTLSASEGSYTITGNEGYVRAEITNSANQMAWTQPIMLAASSIEEDHSSALPQKPSLFQNYPNPFNPSTTIRYALPAESFISIDIYNMLGEKVERLLQGRHTTGHGSVTWNANVSGGIYFCRLSAVPLSNPSERYLDVKKMVLLQ